MSTYDYAVGKYKNTKYSWKSQRASMVDVTYLNIKNASLFIQTKGLKGLIEV